MAHHQQQASAAAPVDANGATLLRVMALMMMLASSAAQSAAVSSGPAANKIYPLPPSSPCIWQKALSMDGSYYSMEVCNVSDEFLESPMPENATAIDRFLQADNIQRRRCHRHESQTECLSEDSSQYGSCTWSAALDVCLSAISPEILRGIFCPDSIALKFEICGSRNTPQECSLETECAYDDTPLVGADGEPFAIGPCRPADWVRLMQAGDNDQAAAELQTYLTAIARPEDITPAEDAEAWGTCTAATFIKTLTTGSMKYVKKSVECASLGVERCSSKPNCVKITPGGSSEAQCVVDNLADRAEQYRMITDANPTSYSRHMMALMDQCGQVKSAKQCQDARLANSTFGEGGRPIVITSATSSSGAAANMGGAVAALAGAALLYILLVL